MLKPGPILDAFELAQMKRGPRDEDAWHRANMAWFEEQIQWAVKQGALPPANRLEGIEADIELARAFREAARKGAGQTRQGA